MKNRAYLPSCGCVKINKPVSIGYGNATKYAVAHDVCVMFVRDNDFGFDFFTFILDYKNTTIFAESIEIYDDEIVFCKSGERIVFEYLLNDLRFIGSEPFNHLPLYINHPLELIRSLVRKKLEMG